MTVVKGIKNRCAVWAVTGLGRWSPLMGQGALIALMILVLRLGSGADDWWPQAATFEPAVGLRPAACLATGCESGPPGAPLLVVSREEAEVSPPLINKEMLALLKTARIEGVAREMAVPMVAAGRMPHKIGGLDGEDRKKLFINVLLPTVMVVLDEVRQERRQLLSILAELGDGAIKMNFAPGRKDWQRRLGHEKTKFILSLTRKYKTERAVDLVAMVDVLPPSLILAQGALESSWGGSHYSLESNNLFGMYASDDGPAPPKIMEFGSILDSVRAYVLHLNRSSAYKELRRIRSQTLDPMRIADGLTAYSERRQCYIDEVKHIIALNRLRHYDNLLLATG